MKTENKERITQKAESHQTIKVKCGSQTELKENFMIRIYQYQQDIREE